MALLDCAGALAAGSPSQMTIGFSPASIVADGASSSTVTAIVTDQGGAGVPGLSVFMFATDAAHHQLLLPTPAHDNGDGTYTSVLTSSATAGPVNVVAGVYGTSLSVGSVLTQTAISTTSVTAVAGSPISTGNRPVTNQPVSFIATVTATPGNVSPSGSVTFEDHGLGITGCATLPLPPGSSPSLTIACGASFDAARSPASLVAVFAPAPGSLVLASTSLPEVFAVDPGPTSSSVALSARTPTARVDSPVSYTALVTPTPLGPLLPAGSVAFLDNGRTISGCAARPLGPFPVATCAVSYARMGFHAITVAYLGDASFARSTSAPLTVAVRPLGAIAATMHWSFVYTPAYTTVQALVVQGVPAGADVVVKCHGRRCPYHRHVLAMPQPRRCSAHSPGRCRNSYTVGLGSRFGALHLPPGTTISVLIRRRGWVGKYFTFVIRPGSAPRVQIGCIAPGSSTPATSC